MHSDWLQLILLPSGTVTLNGQREAVPLVTGDLAVLRPSSSFLLIQTFGAQILWYLDGPLAFITLQPGFGNKVILKLLLVLSLYCLIVTGFMVQRSSLVTQVSYCRLAN